MGLLVGGSERAGRLTQKRNRLEALKKRLIAQNTDIHYVVGLRESEIVGSKYDLEHQNELDSLSNLTKLLDSKKAVMVALLDSEIASLGIQIIAEINASKNEV